jgi:hypothetical protein
LPQVHLDDVTIPQNSTDSVWVKSERNTMVQNSVCDLCLAACPLRGQGLRSFSMSVLLGLVLVRVFGVVFSRRVYTVYGIGD